MNSFFTNTPSVLGTPVVNAFGSKVGRAMPGILRDELIIRDNFGQKQGMARIGIDSHSVFSGGTPIGHIGIDGKVHLKSS